MGLYLPTYDRITEDKVIKSGPSGECSVATAWIAIRTCNLQAIGIRYLCCNWDSLMPDRHGGAGSTGASSIIHDDLVLDLASDSGFDTHFGN